MSRFVLIPCVLALAAVFWFFPLFHIVRLDALRPVDEESTFDAAAFAQDFWKERLIPALNDATDASALLKALRENPQTARDKLGRKVGVSRMRYFLLKGAGTIISVDGKGVSLALDENGSNPDVVLHTGMLFGNTVRDATGLLDAGEFSHSRNFNDISTEINRTVEERVIPAFKEHASIGKKLHFYGCAELADNATDSRPLTIIPLKVRVE